MQQGGLGIVSKGKEIYLFSLSETKKQANLTIAKSKDGLNFVSSKSKVSIKNQNNKAVSVKNCSDFYFTQNEKGEYVVTFRLAEKKKHYYCMAASKTLLNWKIRQKNTTAFEKSVIVPKYTYKKQKVKYSSNGSFYVSFLKTLKRKSFWENFSTPILEPRTGHFDDSSLEIGNVTVLPEVIMLTYYIRYQRDSRHSYAIGVALFDKKHPFRLVWRSSDPVWEMPSEWDNKNISPIGCLQMKNSFIYYWSAKNGEVLSVEFPFQDYLKNVVKGKLSPNVLVKHQFNPILSPIPHNPWESKATMNAAAIYENGRTHLLYRAIGETDVSVIGYASSADGINFDERLKTPIYVPREKFEGAASESYNYGLSPYNSGGGGCGGCEDPRLTKIGDKLYLTYVAFDGYHGPGVAVSSIKLSDFLNKHWNWSKPKLISKPGTTQKNWLLFPEKVNEKYAILHSIAPNVMIDYVDELDDAASIESKRLTNTSDDRWDNIVRGAGAPPIKTKYGWLLFYHAMDRRDPNRYKVGAMILDLKNPKKILYRSKQPLIEPNEKYENEGFKAGVVYVCGATVVNDDLFVYYGGADTVMCVATAKLDHFLDMLVVKSKTILKTINIKK